MNSSIKKKFYIETYGCQMNRADSTSITNILTKNGYQKTDIVEEADFAIINTCSVREHAENRVFARLSFIASVRKTVNKKLTIIVTGCMARSASEKLSALGADIILDVYEQSQIHFYMNDKNYDNDNFKFGYKYEFKKSFVDEDYKHKAYLPITHGCDNWCTYCIVPHTRGPIVSRTSQSIIEETKSLIDSGAKEIMLLGQNVNSYGLDNGDINFVALLEQALHSFPGHMTPHWLKLQSMVTAASSEQ